MLSTNVYVPPVLPSTTHKHSYSEKLRIKNCNFYLCNFLTLGRYSFEAVIFCCCHQIDCCNYTFNINFLFCISFSFFPRPLFCFTHSQLIFHIFPPKSILKQFHSLNYFLNFHIQVCVCTFSII